MNVCVSVSPRVSPAAVIAMASACEKYSRPKEALLYATAALDPDLTRCGTRNPQTRALAMAIQGRSYAALGRTSDAAHALDAAAEVARTAGFWLLEAFALRDLKLLVLDPLGHGKHGSQRLGAVLRLLTGPVERLSPMMGGLDAAELAALEAPDPTYRLSYPSPSPTSATDAAGPGPVTRVSTEELQALGVWALQKRVIASGTVAEQAVIDAVNGPAPKAELIRLLLAVATTTITASTPAPASAASGVAADSAAAHTQLRVEELSGMRLMALHRRAVVEGVRAEAVEDAMDSAQPKARLIELLLVGAGGGPAEGVPPVRSR